MNREDIINMAAQAGIDETVWVFNDEAIERFAALVAEREREACVELCLELGKPNSDDANVEFSHLASYEFGKQVGATTCAAMIRARNEQEQPR